VSDRWSIGKKVRSCVLIHVDGWLQMVILPGDDALFPDVCIISSDIGFK
jgi:hypothetical protein